MAKKKKSETGWTRIYSRIILFVLVCTVGGLIYIWALSRNLPSLEQLENFDPDLVTRIYSSDGVLLKELYTQRRIFVYLEDLPKHLRDAVVASEDRRFESHWGISMRDVMRAVIINTATLSYR